MKRLLYYQPDWTWRSPISYAVSRSRSSALILCLRKATFLLVPGGPGKMLQIFLRHFRNRQISFLLSLLNQRSTPVLSDNQGIHVGTAFHNSHGKIGKLGGHIDAVGTSLQNKFPNFMERNLDSCSVIDKNLHNLPWWGRYIDFSDPTEIYSLGEKGFKESEVDRPCAENPDNKPERIDKVIGTQRV